jgi:hypothetical protein
MVMIWVSALPWSVTFRLADLFVACWSRGFVLRSTRYHFTKSASAVVILTKELRSVITNTVFFLSSIIGSPA